MFKNYFLKKKYNKILSIFYIECKLLNSFSSAPAVKLKEYDSKIFFDFDCSGICQTDKLIKSLNFLKELLKCFAYEYEIFLSSVKVTFYKSDLDQLFYEKKYVSDYSLLLGYNYKNYVYCDIKKSPHLLISGLSGTGKTTMLKSIIYNFNNDIEFYMINCFKSDFREIKKEFILGNKNIYSFLVNFKNNSFYYTSKPRFLIIDDIISLCSDSKIQNLLKEYLSVCRHYNIYIISVLQVARSEDFKCKTFFNSRVCFSQADSSSYKLSLGSDFFSESLNIGEFYTNFNNIKNRTFLF